jgi:hypothetical protein
MFKVDGWTKNSTRDTSQFYSGLKPSLTTQNSKVEFLKNFYLVTTLNRLWKPYTSQERISRWRCLDKLLPCPDTKQKVNFQEHRSGQENYMSVHNKKIRLVEGESGNLEKLYYAKYLPNHNLSIIVSSFILKRHLVADHFPSWLIFCNNLFTWLFYFLINILQ